MGPAPAVHGALSHVWTGQLRPDLNWRVRAAADLVQVNPTRPHREFPFAARHLSNYRQIVAARRPGLIVLLTDLRSRRLAGVVRACQAAFRDADLLVVCLGPGRIELPADTERVRWRRAAKVDRLARVLWRERPAAVMIEFVNDAPTKREVFSQALFTVDDGGLYVIHQLRPGRGAAADHDQLAGWIEGDPERRRSVTEVTNRHESVIIRKEGQHVFKLRDGQLADGSFARRLGPDWGGEIARLPEFEFASRASVEVNRPEHRGRFPDAMTVRTRFLREYRDVVCEPRQTVLRGSLGMPISFHHPGRREQKLRGGLYVNADVDRLRLDGPPVRDLPGTYFHLVSEFPGHFGHVMTEDLGRMWGWPLARQHDPECKLLIGVAPGATRPEPFLQVLLAALGVEADDVVCIDHPVRVTRLIGAGPQFHNRRFVDPGLALTWDRIRDTLQPHPDPSSPSRIFINRPAGGHRQCLNRDLLEQRFVDDGFVLVRPETLSLAEQVRVFSNADAIAGYGGSGMFGMMFSRRPGRRIVISSANYTASNEFLISAVKGDDYVHLWSDARVSHPPGGWSEEAFFAHYSFDFERDGAQLDACLASLSSS